jgi:Oxysterol-binding protein
VSSSGSFALSRDSILPEMKLWAQRKSLLSSPVLSTLTLDHDYADPLTPCLASTSSCLLPPPQMNVPEPYLSRLFYGHWPDKNGRGVTTLVVEQVSHHPPITAYHIANKSRGISLQGHNAQKTSFSGELLSPVAVAPVQQTCRTLRREHYR